jgi:zinc protease
VDEWPVHAKAKRLDVRDGTAQRAQLSFYYANEVDPSKVSRKERLAWSLAGDAMQMRFIEHFREEMGATYSARVTASNSNYRTRFSLLAAFHVDPKQATSLEKAAKAEIARMAKEGISQEHFDKVIKAELKGLETSLKSNNAWRRYLQAAVEFKEPLDGLKTKGELLKSVTVDDLNHAMKTFLDPSRPVVGVHRPSR